MFEELEFIMNFCRWSNGYLCYVTGSRVVGFGMFGYVKSVDYKNRLSSPALFVNQHMMDYDMRRYAAQVLVGILNV